MSSSTPVDRLGRTAAILARLVLVTLIAAASALLLASLFLPGALAADELFSTVQDEVLDIPPLGEADTPPQNSFIYAADGSELAELNFEENRVPVDRDEIPDMVIDAVLATEDATFYEHNGVNHAAIARAALTNFRAGRIESGASTITQQYVKMTFLTPEQTLGRKLEEAVYALRLEDDLEKDEILERYLNRSYFGRGTYGIGTAAERYFSKQIDELELGEAATLAGLLRAPEANNPINSVENAQQRRDIVLTQMAQHGFVSQDQAQAAIDQDLEPDIAEAPVPEQPFWTRWISQLLVNENAAGRLDPNFDKRANAPLSVHTLLGDTREERSRTVHQGGLRIHTTLDPELQDEAEAAIERVLTYEDEPREEIAREPLGSIVSIEPGTGAIRTMGYGPREFGDCAE
ncbi:MAG: transglycosylase domain-containing protein, partial [Actinomycetota bacterium]